MFELPRLLLDMDGIIADFNLYSVRTYNEIHKAGLDENKIHEYLGDHEVIHDSIDPKLFRKPYRDPGAFINLPVIKGSQEAVARLEKYFDIYVVTTQYYGNPTCVHEKHVWLQRHFPSIADKGIFTKHKYMVHGEILVDDRPSNCSTYKIHNPDALTASLTYPWSDKKATDILAPTWEELAQSILEAF
jgi:5'(3')-deoxyribonucleotidase